VRFPIVREEPTLVAPGPAILVENLSKRFGRTLALDGVDLAVQEGELFAILGPNGAGKSTLILILCTLLQADSGTATVAGFDVRTQSRQVRRNLGVVFQEPSLDTRLTVEENLEFHGRVFEVPRRLRRQRMDELLDLVELSDARHRLVRTLSTGMKRRVEIARALLHDSRIVILDEPTIGLDAQSRSRMWDYLRKLQAERGVTLIVTTHYIEEVERCDRIAILDHGTVLALDTPRALKRAHGKQVIRITPQDPETAEAIRERFPEVLTTADGEMLLANAEPLASELLLHEFGQRLREFNLEYSSLETVFLSLTGREIRDRADESRPIGVEGRQPGQEPRL